MMPTFLNKAIAKALPTQLSHCFIGWSCSPSQDIL